MVIIMWINKVEYENLKSTAKDNEYDAKMFRELIKYIKESKTAVFYADFVLINRYKWNELINKFNSEEDKVKDIEAELEWYKVKYHEMKMNAEQ